MGFPGPLVSIVDDDLSVRRALRRLVGAAGFAVETFASAGEFLDSAGARRSACLILDIHLRGMTGFDLQRQIAIDQPGVPVIFMTGLDEAESRERARACGAAAYLHKPFEKESLLEAVRGAVGGEGDRRGPA